MNKMIMRILIISVLSLKRRIRMKTVSKFYQVFLLLISYSLFSNAQTINPSESDFVVNKPVSNKDFPVVSTGGSPSVISYDDSDFPGVVRAIKDLQKDVESVTGKRPLIAAENESPEYEIIIGTLGKSKVIDQLVQSKKLDLKDLEGKWESFVIATIEKPQPGTKKCLVIAGSDKRGTIYGIYELSQHVLAPKCFDDKTVQLFVFAILLGQLRDAALMHARAARKAGASWEEMQA